MQRIMRSASFAVMALGLMLAMSAPSRAGECSGQGSPRCNAPWLLPLCLPLPPCLWRGSGDMLGPGASRRHDWPASCVLRCLLSSARIHHHCRPCHSRCRAWR